MNNILPLLQKAIVEYKSNGDTPADYTVTIPEQIINRFAELIIQDCIKSVEELDVPKNDFRSSTDYGYAQWWEGYDDRGSDDTDTIKKHFEIRV